MVKLKYIILTLLLIGPLTLSALEAITKESGKYVAYIERKYDVASNGRFSISKMAGSIDIETWDQNVILISEKRFMNVSDKSDAEKIVKNVDSEYSASKESMTIKITDDDVYSKFKIYLPRHYDLDLNTSGGDIEIKDIVGKIEAETSGGDIEIKQVEGNIDINTSGGDIDIENAKGDIEAETSGGDLKFVNTIGNIEAETRGGSIEVKNNKGSIIVLTSGGNISLDNVGIVEKAYTSGGGIQLDTSSGDVNLKTSGGDIDIEKVAGFANVKTSGGEINGKRIEKGVDAKTSGGDIELEKVKGPVEAITSGGDLEVEIITDEFNHNDKIDLTSSGGDLKLKLPKNMPAEIEASIKLKSFPWKDYTISSDFPELNGENVIKSKKKIQATGKINGGGAEIVLKTVNGNIKIVN